MTVTPRELVNHAKALKQQDELSWRVAINRGYYGFYHAAKQFHDGLPTPGQLPPTSVGGMGVHAELYHRLCTPSIPQSHPEYTKSKKIGYKARGLKQLREKGDYHLDASILQSEVDMLICSAETTLTELNM